MRQIKNKTTAKGNCAKCGNFIVLTIPRKNSDNLEEMNYITKLLMALMKRHQLEDCEMAYAKKD